VKIVLTEAMTAATTTRRTSAQWSRKSTATGSLAVSFPAICCSKTGVSSILRRMTNPTTTTSALSQKGIRQPHARSCACGRAAIGRKTAVARICPAWVPLRVKLV
jgi:hypothetical protein